MRVGVVVQARMSSRRVPGKVLREVGGKPMLQYLLESLEQCRELDDLCVATSVEPSDDAVAAWCHDRGLPCVRGPLDDVAARFLLAVKERGLDAFVRVCGDSPLLDWRLVDKAVSLFRVGECTMVSNIQTRSYPKGQSVEVLDACMYKNAYDLMLEVDDLEHVTRLLYTQAGICNIASFCCEDDCASVQLSVDTHEDMAVFEALVAKMDRPHWEYGWRQVLALLEDQRA